VQERTRYQTKSAQEVTRRQKADRRGEVRHTIPLPVKVTGADGRDGQWAELAETINVSTSGLAVKLSRKVLIGDILYLQISLPARFRKDGAPSSTQSMYAQVRCVEVQGLQQVVRVQYVQGVTRRPTIEVSAKY